MNNVSVECLLVALDVGQHRSRDHILRSIIFGQDVENAVDDAVHELLVGHEAWLELWEEGKEVIPVSRDELPLEGAVLYAHPLQNSTQLLGYAQHGVPIKDAIL